MLGRDRYFLLRRAGCLRRRPHRPQRHRGRRETEALSGGVPESLVIVRASGFWWVATPANRAGIPRSPTAGLYRVLIDRTG